MVKKSHGRYTNLIPSLPPKKVQIKYKSYNKQKPKKYLGQKNAKQSSKEYYRRTDSPKY